MPWKDQAACRGADLALFFPEPGAKYLEAKVVCDRCPVKVECLDYALDNGELFGIWGGSTEKERRRLRRKPKVACAECGAMFRVARGNVVTCSQECSDRRRRRQQNQSQNARKAQQRRGSAA